MDEIGKRLQETADTCSKCYEAWSKDKRNSAVSEALQESIHELRRVASRLEIEVAISERDEGAQKPIPIPPHRDANRKSQGSDDDDAGNRNDDAKGRSGPKIEQKGRRKREPKKAAGGEE